MATTILVSGSTADTRKQKIREILKERTILESNILFDESEKKGINEVRSWISWLNITSGQTKALVVTNAELLTVEAQNAFLKTLEEPPEKCLIILESININSLLPTVISRCVIVDTGVAKALLDEKTTSRLSEELQILNRGVGAKFSLAKELSNDRASASFWINELLTFLHSKMTTEDDLSKKIKNLLVAKKQLNSNTNVRLTLENLFLKW